MPDYAERVLVQGESTSECPFQERLSPTCRPGISYVSIFISLILSLEGFAVMKLKTLIWKYQNLNTFMNLENSDLEISEIESIDR